VKKLLLALSLALMLVLALGIPALADDGYWECWEEEGYLDSWEEEGYLNTWDEEGHDECWDEEGHQVPDSLIWDNDNFHLALGYVDISPPWYASPDEWHYGGNSNKPDGYDVYRDDGSGEGLLGNVKVLETGIFGNIEVFVGESTFYFATEPGTQYVVDKEAGCVYVVDKEAGEKWIVTKEAGEEWVVTKEAGCEYHSAGNAVDEFTLILGDLKSETQYYCGCGAEKEVTLSNDIVQVTIPMGLHMVKANGQNARWIEFSASGSLISNITFKSGEPIVTKL